VVVGLILGWRIHMAAILDAYDEHRHLVSYQESQLKEHLVHQRSDPSVFEFTIRDGVWLTLVVGVGLVGVIAYNRLLQKLGVRQLQLDEPNP